MNKVIRASLMCCVSLSAVSANDAIGSNRFGDLFYNLSVKCLDYSFLYYIAKAGIFNGIVKKDDILPESLKQNGVISKRISATYEESEGKCGDTVAYFRLDGTNATEGNGIILLSFGGNQSNGYSAIYRGIDEEKNNFILPTASVRYRYFHDPTISFMSKASNVSEKTIYEDGIRLYEYVTKVLGFKKIVLLGYSEGGSVASNLARYIEDSGKGESIKGIILASPIDGIKSSAEKYTGSKLLGSLAGIILRNEKLDTFDNLSFLKNKDIPVLIVSGGEKDFLSLKFTHIDERMRKAGFTNVYSLVNNVNNHTDSTFDIEQIELNEKGDILVNIKKIEEYIENKDSYWECFDENGQRMMTENEKTKDDAHSG